MSVTWYGDQIIGRIRLGAMQGVMQGIAIVEKRAVYLITNGPKTGRVYRRRGVFHQASAPGEAPASDTGTLVNARTISQNESDLSATLTFNSAHAGFLERGTRNMAPRPFGRRALAETREQVLDAIHKSVAARLIS